MVARAQVLCGDGGEGYRIRFVAHRQPHRMTMKALHHDQPNPTDGARLCFVVLTTKHTNLAPVPSHPRSDAGRTCVVKATESDSSLTDSLTDSGTEGPRLCFVVLTTKAYESASCPALPRQTKETNLPSWLPPPRQTKETNLGSCRARCPTEWDSCAFMGLASESNPWRVHGGVGGGFPCVFYYLPR